MLDYYLMNGYIRHYNVPGTNTNFGSSIIIGGGYNTLEYGAGYMTELLIHNIVVPTSELDTIHRNMGSYHNIKVASTPGYLSFPDMTNVHTGRHHYSMDADGDRSSVRGECKYSIRQ